MRIAHLILGHKNPAQLERLIRNMDHPQFDFYIHIDKKIDEQPFRYLLKLPRVNWINKRTPVYWGAYGTIQATINGFEEILATNKDYLFVNVISAQDFPIKTADELYEHLRTHQHVEFITCESIKDTWKQAAPRVQDYHFINWRIPGKHKLEKIATKLLPKRKFPLPNYEFVGRANWFTLSPAAIRYSLQFLKDNPKVVRFFKYCWGADEFIFSMILYNSPTFKSRLVHNLVYVDWTGQTQGHPRIMDSSDFEKLKASPLFFARKFDMDAKPEIFDLLEEYLKNKVLST